MFSKSYKCTASVTVTSLLLHAVGFLWYSFGVYQDRSNYNVPVFELYGGRFKFLTMITVYLIWISSGYAFIVDLLQLTTNIFESPKPTKSDYPESRSFFIQLRDELMSGYLYTFALVVVIMYWGLAAVDLEGIHPAAHRIYVPLFGWFNQFLHTIPLPYALLLVIFVNYQYSPMKRVLLSLAGITFAYFLWMSRCAKMNGVWPYGFIDKLSRQGFIIFFVSCNVFAFGVYLSGRKISSLVWNVDRRDKSLIKIENKRM